MLRAYFLYVLTFVWACYGRDYPPGLETKDSIRILRHKTAPTAPKVVVIFPIYYSNKFEPKMLDYENSIHTILQTRYRRTGINSRLLGHKVKFMRRAEYKFWCMEFAPDPAEYVPSGQEWESQLSGQLKELLGYGGIGSDARSFIPRQGQVESVTKFLTTTQDVPGPLLDPKGTPLT